MFNLIKFEILKRKQLFVVLSITFFVAQLFTMYKFTFNNNMTDPLALMFLLSFVSYIVFLFSSISNFSKDINLVDRSVAFMVPKSGFVIISAKFLATLLLGVGLLAFSSLITFINLYYINPQNGLDFINYILTNTDLLGQIILGVATLGSFFALVFLSIIITKTFLSKLKFKTIIVIIIMSILSKGFNMILNSSLQEVLSQNRGLSFILTILITTLMLWISGWLIDNKTDL